jgi:hypothetical protein
MVGWLRICKISFQEKRGKTKGMKIRRNKIMSWFGPIKPLAIFAMIHFLA